MRHCIVLLLTHVGCQAWPSFPATCTAPGPEIVLDAAIVVKLEWETQSQVWSKKGGSSLGWLVETIYEI